MQADSTLYPHFPLLELYNNPMLTLEKLQATDIVEIAAAFAKLGWDKPASQYEAYLAEQEAGERVVIVAHWSGVFVGYVTVVWHAHYTPFAAENIPEIADFNVLPEWRKRGFGAALMDEAERVISERSTVAGIGVGMTADYGAAQRLYVTRGYIPDGRGLTYDGKVLAHGESAINDDSLVLYFTKALR
jgi:GNAT superfamily N-acetyltransferase